MGFAFLLEYFDNTIKNEQDIEKTLGLPLLVVIVPIDIAHLKQRGSSRNERNAKARGESVGFLKNNKEMLMDNRRKLISAVDPKSPIAEHYRTMRTNDQFVSIDKELNTILITSDLERGKVNNSNEPRCYLFTARKKSPIS